MGKVSVFLHTGGKQQFAALQKNYTNISGSIGFTYKITEQFYFKMNFARGFRAPSISEITSNGAHEGTIRFEYGNVNLKPEINHQLDMGIELNTKHIGISITPFFNRIDNFIYYRKIASLKGGDSTLLEKDSKETLYAFTYNQGTAIVYGGEAAIEIHPHPLDWLHIESDFSYLNNQKLNHPDSTKYLPFMPPPRWVNEIKTEWNNLGKNIKSFYIKGELVYNFAQDHFFKAYDTETRTPDYTLINAVTGVKIKQSEHVVFEINAGVNNIMDIAYQSHLNRLKYLPINLSTGRQGVFNMGRNIFVNVAVRF